MHYYPGPDRFAEYNNNFEGGFHPHMRALYDELHALRSEGPRNGRIYPGEYRAETTRMERMGYLPQIHLDMSQSGTPRHIGDAGQETGASFGHRHHRRHHHRHHGRGHHHHKRYHHHKRHHAGLDPMPGGVGPKESGQEAESNGALGPDRSLTPTDTNPPGADRLNFPGLFQLPWLSAGKGDTVPVQRGRASDMSVTSGPTITPQKIDEVLKQYHSPAYGRVSGQEVYDKSVQHGINPAVALAFYVLESSAGTRGKGARNNSWGNIRGGDARDGYKSYDNIHSSLDHFLNLISGPGYVGQGRTTLGTILPKYAPRADGNNPGRYIENMAGLIRKWAS